MGETSKKDTEETNAETEIKEGKKFKKRKMGTE